MKIKKIQTFLSLDSYHKTVTKSLKNCQTTRAYRRQSTQGAL